MSNPFESPIGKPIENIEEAKNRLARLLSQTRYNMKPKKSLMDFAAELGVEKQMVSKWENGTVFPDQEKLPLIAKVYGLELDLVLEAYRISKEAREKEKESRRTKTSKLKIDRDNEFFLPDGSGKYGK